MESKVCPLVGLSHYLNSLVGLSVDKDTNTHIYVAEIQPACASGKLSREKTCVNFVYLQKFSPRNLGHGILLHNKSKQYMSFLCKNRIFHQFAKVFSLKNFPLYATLTHILSLLAHAHKHLHSHTESQTPLCFLLLRSVWLPGGSSR